MASHQASPEDRMGVYVVIPAYNEEQEIAPVVRGVLAERYRPVVVDDGSRDRTAERARDAGAEVLIHPINRGQGAALQTGITFSLSRGADYIVTFDADGQHAPEDIPLVLAPIAEGRADIVLGSRFLAGGRTVPVGRRWLLRAAVAFTKLMSGAQVTDTHNGLRAFSRRAAERIHLRLDGMAHASELIDQVQHTGFKYIEVPVTVVYTEYSMRKGQRASAAFRILTDYIFGRVFG